MFMPNSSTLRITCKVAVVRRGPPGLPVARMGWPSWNTMVGDMELSGFLPGRMALASAPISPYAFIAPGLAEKSSISLFKRIPVPGTTMPEPKLKFSV